MTLLRSMITSLKKGRMVTIARSAPGCCQPSWHRWHGLPTMGWLRTGGGENAVLRKIVAVVSNHLLPTETLTSDLSNYQFPHHIVPTSSRPDIVWWDGTKKKLSVVELTICFETSFDGAAERKQAKYVELQQRAQDKGFKAILITVEVGSRRIINNPGFTKLKKELRLSEREVSTMVKDISIETIMQSHQIWCQRNNCPTQNELTDIILSN